MRTTKPPRTSTSLADLAGARLDLRWTGRQGDCARRCIVHQEWSDSRPRSVDRCACDQVPHQVRAHGRCRVTKPTQPPLHSILVVPHRESLTEREIRKRGGPVEIEAKRMRPPTMPTVPSRDCCATTAPSRVLRAYQQPGLKRVVPRSTFRGESPRALWYPVADRH